MSRKRKPPHSAPPPKVRHGAPAEARANRLVRPALLASWMALVVARPLVAGDIFAGASGDGLVFVTLWLILAVAWSLAAAVRWIEDRPFDRVDASAAALIAWLGVSTLYAVWHGSPRPAVNAFWEWTALVVCFLLARRLLASERDVRAIVVVMMSLAVGLSAHGYYQYLYELPATREAYRADPEGMLRASGVAAPPGSVERQLLEKRLASTEPLATFSLANSLAAFLVPWIVIAAGIAATKSAAATADRGLRGARVASAIWFLVLVGCLVLTKSRSSIVGAALGLASIPFVAGGTWRRRVAWFAAMSPVLAMIVAGLLALGVLDRQVLSEAPKSLAYRFEYWTATWRLIEDHMWLGCGLGNFQDTYTPYKLPAASEAVSDPHNWLLEVWAVAGLPALMLLLTTIAMAIASTTRRRMSNERATDRAEAPAEPDVDERHDRRKQEHSRQRERAATSHSAQELDRATLAIALGLPLGLIVGMAAGQGASVDLSITAAIFVLVAWLVVETTMLAWSNRGTLHSALLIAALAALGVSLLAAGGIGLPGVSISLWVLLGAISAHRAASADVRTRGRVAPRACVAVALCLAVLAWMTALAPVTACRHELAAASDNPHRVHEHLRAAAQADPLAAEPWQAMADLAFARWRQSNDARDLAEFSRSAAELVRRRPSSSAARRVIGERYLEVFERTGSEPAARSAVEHLTRAVDLYPNHALTRAVHALALAAAGDRQRATREARLADELSRATPHEDQKLPAGLSQRLSDAGLSVN